MERDKLLQIIGKNLHKYRTARRLTQDELSEKAGISTPFYANLERGKKAMSIFVLRDLADALGISTDSLLYDNQANMHLQNIASLLRNQPKSSIVFIENVLRLYVQSTEDTANGDPEIERR